MGDLISLKEFKKQGLVEKNSVDGTSLKKKGKPASDKPMFVEVTVAREIMPRLGMSFARRVLVIADARKLVADALTREGGRIGKKSMVMLVRLHEDHTATLEEARAFLDSLGCRLACVEEFMSFVITRTAREESRVGPIFALETGAADEYGFHQGIAYLGDSLKQKETVFLSFAERIRHGWLILAAHGRVARLKKSTS